MPPVKPTKPYDFNEPHQVRKIKAYYQSQKNRLEGGFYLSAEEKEELVDLGKRISAFDKEQKEKEKERKLKDAFVNLNEASKRLEQLTPLIQEARAAKELEKLVKLQEQEQEYKEERTEALEYIESQGVRIPEGFGDVKEEEEEGDDDEVVHDKTPTTKKKKKKPASKSKYAPIMCPGAPSSAP